MGLTLGSPAASPAGVGGTHGMQGQALGHTPGAADDWGAFVSGELQQWFMRCEREVLGLLSPEDGGSGHSAPHH